ncbi:MAG: hypothetical protein AB8G99_26755, partial [Planctomycetaceae bacterium]
TSSLESGTVTFELLETSEFPRVKVTRPTQLSVSAICFQRQDESGPLGWTWVYRLQGAKGISEAQVHPKGGRLETALPMQTDDQGLASISLSGDSNELVIIHYDTGDLTIPESEWKDASMQSRILALPKASSIRPENSRESEVALPAWASQFAKTEVILFDDDTAWNLVQRDETQPDTQSLTVRQIETILWHDKGIIAGKTTMALEPLPNGQLEVLLPQDVQVQSVEAGPRKLEFDMEQPTLLIPCPNIEQVTVRWTVASNNKTFSVPAPLMDAGEMLFAFLPGSPDTTIVSTEFAKITRDDYLANRFFTSDPPAEPAGLFLGRISSRMRPGQQLQIVSTSRSGPLAGIGLLCGVVVFAGSFSATQLRTRNRVPFILGGVALLLIVAGGSLWIVAGLILTATLLRWYLPHRM